MRVSHNELLLRLIELQVKFVKQFKTKSLDSDKKTAFVDSKIVLLHFSCSEFPKFRFSWLFAFQCQTVYTTVNMLL